MSNLYLFIFTVVFILMKFSHYAKSDYIDVAELGFKIRDDVLTGKKGNTNLNYQNHCVCPQDPIPCDMLNRFVNKIPLAALIREENEESVDIKMKFGIGELKILKEFTQRSCESNNDAYRIMNSAIRKMEIITNDNQVKWTMLIYEFLNHNQEMLVFASVILLIFLLLIWWWTFSKSWWQVFIKGFVLLLVTGSVWNWMRMYKDAQAEKMAVMEKTKGEIPLDCRPKDMGIWDSFVHWLKGSFTFSEDACRKYYKHFTVDVFWDINPLTAVSDILSRMTLHPLKVIGEYLAVFIRELFSRLPVQLWIPVGIFVCVTIFFCIVACFKYRIRLPFWFVMEPALPQPPPVAQQALPQQNFNQPVLQQALPQQNVIEPVPQHFNQINNPQLQGGPQNENIPQNEKNNKSQILKETNLRPNITQHCPKCCENCIENSSTEQKTEECVESNTELIRSPEISDTGKTIDHSIKTELIPPGNKVQCLKEMC